METTKEKPYALALLAALGLGLVGGLIYGALYYFGYIAYVGALAIFWLAAIGFKKVRKVSTLQKKDYVILALLSVLIVFVVIISVLWIVVMQLGYSFNEAFNALVQALTDSTVIKTVIIDFLFGALFVVISAVTVYLNDKRKLKKAEETREKNQTPAEQANTEEPKTATEEETTEGSKE